MLGGAGKDTITPETCRNKGTGTVHTSFKLFRSQRDAGVHQTKFSKAFQETGFALPDEQGRRSHDFQVIIQVLQCLTTKSPWVSQSQEALQQVPPLALTALEC